MPYAPSMYSEKPWSEHVKLTKQNYSEYEESPFFANVDFLEKNPSVSSNVHVVDGASILRLKNQQ